MPDITSLFVTRLYRAALSDQKPRVDTAELEALCMDLLRRRPEERPSGADILRRLGAVDAPRSRPTLMRSAFVGREPHFAALKEGFAATHAGLPSAAILHGAMQSRSPCARNRRAARPGPRARAGCRAS